MSPASFALQATMLLRITARSGEWCSLESLASHCGVSMELARDACGHLVLRDSVHYAAKGEQHFYGVKVDGVRLTLPAAAPGKPEAAA
jgi:hypothetical protein